MPRGRPKPKPDSDVMSTHEVAALFRVDPKTVVRWEENGLLFSDFRTLGGHRRYFRSKVEAARKDAGDRAARDRINRMTGEYL